MAYKRSLVSLILVPLFFALAAYYFLPPYDFDLYRHYDAYRYFIELKEFKYGVKDLYLPSLFYLGAIFDFNPEYLAFISNFLLYFTLMYLCHCMTRDVGLSDEVAFLFLFLFILTNSLVLYSGLRYSTGLSFSLLFAYFYFYKSNSVRAFFFLALAVLSHVSFLFLLLVFFVYKLFVIKVESRLYFVGMIVFFIIFGFFFAEGFVNHGFIFIQELSGIYLGAETYTTGEWGADRLVNSGLNSTGILIENLKKYSIFFLVLYSNLAILKSKSKINNFEKFFILFSSLTCLLIKYDVLYLRYADYALMLSLLWLCQRRVVSLKLNSVHFLFVMFFCRVVFVRYIELKYYSDYFIDSYSIDNFAFGLGVFNAVLQN
ncbi:EpsG family protein [Vibrio renipiscarius]|uniref:hypothetical protein n=1 Tax=Vibrio renipiscarius TaxID=1461322 RepID=UPI00354B6B5F